MAMKKLFLIVVLPIIFLCFAQSWAADRYVDYRPGYSASCSAGSDNDYDPVTRDCGSGSDLVYSTMQGAENASSYGDIIWIREGTYNVTGSGDGMYVSGIGGTGSTSNFLTVRTGRSGGSEETVTISGDGTTGQDGFDIRIGYVKLLGPFVIHGIGTDGVRVDTSHSGSYVWVKDITGYDNGVAAVMIVDTDKIVLDDVVGYFNGWNTTDGWGYAITINNHYDSACEASVSEYQSVVRRMIAYANWQNNGSHYDGVGITHDMSGPATNSGGTVVGAHIIHHSIAFDNGGTGFLLSRAEGLGTSHNISWRNDADPESGSGNYNAIHLKGGYADSGDACDNEQLVANSIFVVRSGTSFVIRDWQDDPTRTHRGNYVKDEEWESKSIMV
jgi:hypothetical protein